jgi:hypothetical protein
MTGLRACVGGRATGPGVVPKWGKALVSVVMCSYSMLTYAEE